MLYWLAEKGYDHVHLVGGEDRQGQYEAFKDLMSSTRRKDRLKLKSLTIVGAGKRDENATGVQGMSASNFVLLLPQTTSRLSRAECPAKPMLLMLKTCTKTYNGV